MLALSSLSWLLCAILLEVQAAQIPFIPPIKNIPIKTFTTSHDATHSASGQTKFSVANYRRPLPIPQMAPAKLYSLSEIRLKAIKRKIWRPRARGGSDEYMQARMASVRTSRGQPHPPAYVPMEWDEVEMETPDVTDIDTLAGLAKMTSKAYVEGSHQGIRLGGKRMGCEVMCSRPQTMVQSLSRSRVHLLEG